MESEELLEVGIVKQFFMAKFKFFLIFNFLADHLLFITSHESTIFHGNVIL